MLPLRYYLSGGGDDERFSWRMFSTTRLLRCEVELYAVDTAGTREPVDDLRRDLQAAWVGMLLRNRPQVVDRYLERRCGAPRVTTVEFVRRCQRSDGQRMPTTRVLRACTTATPVASPMQNGGNR